MFSLCLCVFVRHPHSTHNPSDIQLQVCSSLPSAPQCLWLSVLRLAVNLSLLRGTHVLFNCIRLIMPQEQALSAWMCSEWNQPWMDKMLLKMSWWDLRLICVLEWPGLSVFICSTWLWLNRYTDCVLDKLCSKWCKSVEWLSPPNATWQ